MVAKEWTVHCPDCGERIRIDTKTGVIIAHGKGTKPANLGEAAKQREERQAGKKDAFADAMKAEKGRSAELEQLFKKANEEADKEEGENPSDSSMEDRWR